MAAADASLGGIVCNSVCNPACNNDRRYSATNAVFSSFLVVAAIASQVRANCSMVIGFYGFDARWLRLRPAAIPVVEVRLFLTC
jgi:hypothetical protein